MQSKFPILFVVTIAIAVAFFYFAGGDGDQELAQQIAERQRQDNKKSPTTTTASDVQESVRRLTDSVVAEKSNALGDWTVIHRNGPGSLTLPFMPNAAGTLPVPVSGSTPADIAPTEFVGAAACQACHKEKHSGFIHTAHHQTSGVPKPGEPARELAGEFAAPNNRLTTKDSGLSYVMTKVDKGYVQTAMIGDWKQDVPLDVFTGSAKTGRTFLYWKGDALFQSHVSYLSGVDEWIPSPGYEASKGDYTRRIRSACLECHMTYMQPKPGANRYHRETAIWGVSCERCHGPGGTHVRFHEQNPDQKTAHAIVHPRDLSRQKQLDICGQCHSGSFTLAADAFSYRPGSDLAEFHQPKDAGFKGVGGIHTSNQLTRLSMSECFKQSEMTCTTCHDPHANQRDDLQAFTAKCLECHQPQACGQFDQIGEKISNDCVSCHMPVGDNEGMTLEVSQGSLTISMIDHYIRIVRQQQK